MISFWLAATRHQATQQLAQSPVKQLFIDGRLLAFYHAIIIGRYYLHGRLIDYFIARPVFISSKMINGRKRSRCGLMLSSALVIMTQNNISQQLSVFTYAYLSTSLMPMQRYRRLLRSSKTRLHEVNVIAVQDNSSFHNDVGYDANSIIDFYDRRPWEIGLRLNMIGLPLLGMFTSNAVLTPSDISSIFLTYLADSQVGVLDLWQIGF